MPPQTQTVVLCHVCGALGAHAEHIFAANLTDVVSAACVNAQGTSGEIQVLNLIEVAARHPDGPDAFGLHGINSEHLEVDARIRSGRQTAKRALYSTAGGARFSLALISVLRLARDIADRRRSRAVTLDDVVLACLQSAAGDAGIDLLQRLVFEGRQRPSPRQSYNDRSLTVAAGTGRGHDAPSTNIEQLSRELLEARAETARLAAHVVALTAAITPQARGAPASVGTARDAPAAWRGVESSVRGKNPCLLVSRTSLFTLPTAHIPAGEQLMVAVTNREHNGARATGGSTRNRLSFASLRRRATARTSSRSDWHTRDSSQARDDERTFETSRPASRAVSWHRRHSESESSREYMGYAEPSRAAARRESRPRDKRFYLTLDNDIVDAPSIGARTAERLRGAGIHTVRDILEANAGGLAASLKSRSITGATIAIWQHQARLVVTVPFLRGSHAQLLVGAGFTMPDEIASADGATLLASILRFAQTRDGQSVLRSGPPPDLEKVVAWARNAAEAEIERAA